MARTCLLPLLLFVGSFPACSSEARHESTDAAHLQLDDGRTLADLAVGSVAILILISDPGDCFSCGGFLGAWAKEAQRNRESVFLVLTREPTFVEKRRILAARLPIMGMLNETDPPWSLAPWELAFHNGELVYSGSIAPNSSTTHVLSELEGRSPDEAVRRLRKGN